MTLLEKLNQLEPNYHFTEAYITYHKGLRAIGIYILNFQLPSSRFIFNLNDRMFRCNCYEINKDNLGCYALTHHDWVKVGPIKFTEIYDKLNTLLLLA